MAKATKKVAKKVTPPQKPDDVYAKAHAFDEICKQSAEVEKCGKKAAQTQEAHTIAKSAWKEAVEQLQELIKTESQELPLLEGGFN